MTDDRDLSADIEALVRLGSLLLAAGVASFHAKDAMRRCGARMGIHRLDCVSGSSHLIVTGRREGQSFTVVREIFRTSVDASRIEALEDMVTTVKLGITAEELHRRLDHVARHVSPRWSVRTMAIAAGLASGCFALLNSISVGSALVAMVAAGIGQLVLLRLKSRLLNEFAASALAAVVAAAVFSGLGWALDATRLPVLRSISGPGYVAALLFLIPGFPMITAILDLARMDFTAGLSRACHALGIVVSATAAAALVALVIGLQPLPTPIDIRDLWWWPVQAVASFVGIGGFALLFNSSRRMALSAGALGMGCNLARLFLVQLGWPPHLVAFLGGLSVGLVAAVVGPRLRVPRIALSVPASVIMVPGAAMYRTVYWLNEYQLGKAMEQGTHAGLVVFAIDAGLAVARLLTDAEWAQIRPRPDPFAYASGGGGAHT